MKEFKGTKEDLTFNAYEPSINEFGAYGIDISSECKNQYITVWLRNKYPTEEELSDIQAISTYPKLIESLQDLLKTIEDNNKWIYTDKSVNNAKKVLDEALGYIN